MLDLEVTMLVQEGEEGGPCLPSGVALVNELSYGQRLGLLRVATEALLCHDVSERFWPSSVIVARNRVPRMPVDDSGQQ